MNSSKESTMRSQIWKNFAKLGFAGATIAAIGFAFVTLTPTEDGLTADASADISDFTALAVGGDRQFADAIRAMGLKPRPFDMNGNTMYFASGNYRMAPLDVMRQTQALFVETGVNEKNHSDLIPVRQKSATINWDSIGDDVDKSVSAWETLMPAASATYSGDVVPTQVSHDYVEMVGMDLLGSSDQEMWERVHAAGGDPMNMIKGYRFMDIHAEKGGERSAVTAVWSDNEDFQAQRFVGRGDQSPPDPNVPACLGCSRDFRVQSLAKDEPFQSNMFSVRGGNVQGTYEYYRDSLQQQGWKETGVQPYLNRLGQELDEVADLNDQGRVLNFERGDESMQFAVIDAAGSVQVISMHEKTGAQNELPQ